METKNYYMGLDLGTNSVGWAVTDPHYHLQRYGQQHMWGTRLFDEADTKADRRVFRSTRRKRQRVKQRLRLLQDLFAPEIEAIDPLFFIRLNESKFHPEDKHIDTTYTLFDDRSYTDQHYHQEYPTIYHLRKELMTTTEKKDLRLYYLALHHLMKSRGHFLFQGTFEQGQVYDQVMLDLKHYLSEHLSIQLDEEDFEPLKDIIQSTQSMREKKKQMNQLVGAKTPQYKAILNVMIGGKSKLSVIFQQESYKEVEKPTIDFKTSQFDDAYDVYESILGDDIELLLRLRAVYDWMVLGRILGSHHYVSEAMVADYEQHKEDLSQLKYFVKQYGTKEQYEQAFVSTEVLDNYTAYIHDVSQNGKRQANKYANQETVNRYFERLLASFDVLKKDKQRYNQLMERLTQRKALPKQRTSDNSVIPYQLHQKELELILSSAATHYPFLTKKDPVDLMTPEEKVKQLFTYRIPYYIGPVNPAHQHASNDQSHAWVVRKSSGEVLPWNFNDKVDVEQTAERFIRRMTKKDTYLIGEDVLPEESLVYELFKVLNELNPLKINHEPISVELKQDIVNDLFRQYPSVTRKRLKEYLIQKGYPKDSYITGIDGDFKSNLKSYVRFKDILGPSFNQPDNIEMAEQIILWRSIFDNGGTLYQDKVTTTYGHRLTEEQLTQIHQLTFSGWGRLSKRFLTEINGMNRITGEMFDSILDALMKTNDNLSILLSSEYTFADHLEQQNDQGGPIETITYENVMANTTLSSPAKRTVWQTIRIIEEVRQIKKAAPSHIFLETTRNPDNKKERKDSRRTQLIQLYEALNDPSYQSFIDELNELTDKQLRQKGLYLYYLQQGRSLYTGRPLNRQQVLTKQDHVYDIDHILPRSLTKDDSYDNLVLVERTINQRKSNQVLDASIQAQMKPFWYQLRQQGFLTQKKLDRLLRTDALTAEELSGFINRQLVETSQATKEAANLLRRIYPNTKIVYVRSRLVSDFRHQFGWYKIRELNDEHHAHDAYFNIIAGNAYFRRFTDNPYHWIKQQMQSNDTPYNLSRFFDRIVYDSEGRVVWKKERDVPIIKYALAHRPINITRMSIIGHGGFYNQQPSRKTNKPGLAPLKTTDTRLLDTSKYGGYNSVASAYYYLVEHTVKEKRETTLETVYLKDMQRIQSIDDLITYSETVHHLVDPDIKIERILLNSKVEYNGLAYYLQGRTGNRYILSSAHTIQLMPVLQEAFRMAVKLDNQQPLHQISDDEAHVAMNQLYQAYLAKYQTKEMEKRVNSIAPVLANGSDQFTDLTLAEKAYVIMQIHRTFTRRGAGGVDLRLIGGKQSSGASQMGKKLTTHQFSVIHQPVTGLIRS